MIALLTSLTGCGEEDTQGRMAISGIVTFEGKPLDRGTIEFTSVGEATAHTGTMIEDGSYDIPARQGLQPGKYLVRISSVADDPNVAPEMPGMTGEGGVTVAQDRIPAEYNTESKQEVTIESDGPNEFDFNIP